MNRTICKTVKMASVTFTRFIKIVALNSPFQLTEIELSKEKKWNVEFIDFISEKVQGILLIYKWFDPSLKEYQSSLSLSP